MTAARHSPTRGCWELQIAGGGGAEGGGISSFDALVLAVPDTALGAAAVRSIGTAGASDEAARRTTRCRDELRLNEHAEWTAPPSSRALGPTLSAWSSRPGPHLHAVLSVHCPGALSTLPTLEKCESRQATEPSISARLLAIVQTRDHLIRKESKEREHTKHTDSYAGRRGRAGGPRHPRRQPRRCRTPRSARRTSHLPTAPHMSPHISTAPCAQKRGRDCALYIVRASTEPQRAALDTELG